MRKIKDKRRKEDREKKRKEKKKKGNEREKEIDGKIWIRYPIFIQLT